MAGQSTDRLDRRLASHASVGLDTSIWIYHLEAHPRYLPLTTHLLSGIEFGRRIGIISVTVLLELTVRPFRVRQPEVARHYEALLAHFPNLDIIDIDRDIARQAAQLRGEFGVGAMDALQIATALKAGATAFVTNDLTLTRFSATVDIIVLEHLLDHAHTSAE